MNTKYFHKARAAAFVSLTALTIAAGCGNSEKPTTEGAASTGVTTDTTATPSVASPPAASTMSGMAHGEGSHTMGSRGVDALKTLRSKEFDIAFLSQMIAHHEAAVTMAKQALSSATKPDTKQAAQAVIEGQGREIAQMTRWLKSWYDLAPSKAQQALVNQDMQGMMGMPVTSDQMFYAMMIPHHQGAIDMSELAATRSQRPEVKKLAEQIIRDQKEEIAAYRKMAG